MKKFKFYSFKDIWGFLRLKNLRKKLFKKNKVDEEPILRPTNELSKKLHPSTQVFFIKEIIERSPSTKSYILQGESAAYFRPGSYLTIRENVAGSTIKRPVSISSSPTLSKSGIVELTIKRTADGFFSPHAHENWKVGDKVITGGPEGLFTYNPLRDNRHIIAYAGGNGVTPFVSYAYAIMEGILDCSMTLLYGFHGESEGVFVKELEEIAAICPNFKLVVKEDSNGFFAKNDIIAASEGKPYSLFACGPQPMYRYLDKVVEDLNLAPGLFRKETFGIAKDPSTYSDAPTFKDATHKITVHIRDKDFVLLGKENETVLISLEKAGISVPSACRGGTCGACRSKLIKGEVYIPTSLDRRRTADTLYNYIHLCISYPLSDIELDIPYSD